MSDNNASIDNENKFLCVLICVLDIIHVCDEFPVEDQDKRCRHGRWQRGGNASNNCTVLRQLGVECEFFGPIIKSKMFQFVLDDMTDRKIDFKHCAYHECETAISSIILNESTGSRTIIHSNPNMPHVTYDDFKSLNLNDYGWIHFEGRHHDETSKMIKSIVAYNKAGRRSDIIKISLDLEKLQMENFSLTNFADVVILSKDLATHLRYENKTTAVYKFRQLTRKGNIIVCPWGADGVAALDSNENLFTADAYPPEINLESFQSLDYFVCNFK